MGQPVVRELTAPVSLCDPDRPGRLNPKAVGWSREPLHQCHIDGRRFAKKRWNYWAFATESHLFSATVADLDYAGLVALYIADFERGRVDEKTVVTPLGHGCQLPDQVRESVRFAGRGVELELLQKPDAVVVNARAKDFPGGALDAEFEAIYPPAHETLNVVIPWDDRRFQFTAKHNCLPAHGRLQLGEREIDFDGPQSFACLDFGRGVWPRRCHWNWGAASGVQDGRIIGLNLGGQWTRGTGATENAICVSGRLEVIPEELEWQYSRENFSGEWSIRAPESGAVDLRFLPFLERSNRINTGLVKSEVHQLFGHYQGTLRLRDGRVLKLQRLVGWAEEHLARW